MIWTTTPWTLPANVAIAVHPDLTYAGVRYIDPASGRTVRTILAADLVAKVMALGKVTDYAEVGRCRGASWSIPSIGTRSSIGFRRSSWPAT